MRRFLFDTCFLIDLQREMASRPGKAHRFLQQNAESKACICWTVAGEFAEGFGDIHHPVCSAMLARFEVFASDENVAHQYAVTARRLRAENQLIGANDLWIAAVALAKRIPLVTNNSAHFGRIAGLLVMKY